MRIDRLKLQNFRCFATQEWEFSPQFNVFIGDNGDGKTTVLNALALGLNGYLVGFGTFPYRKIETQDVHLVPGGTTDLPTLELRYPVRIELKGTLNQETLTWYRTLEVGNERRSNRRRLQEIVSQWQEQLPNPDGPLLPAIAYYTAGRLWRQEPRDGRETLKPGSRLRGYRSCFFAQANENDVRKWVQTLSISERERGGKNAALSAVHEAVIRCLPEPWTEFRYDTLLGELVVTDAEKRRIMPTQLLSHGQRNVIALVADLAYRCAILNPHLGAKAALETPGVVLIDELDLHLHPSWQQAIVKSLREAFPKIQFFATTHSPLIIQSLHPGELIDLGGGHPRDYFKQSVEEILTDEMGVKEVRRSQEFQEMIQTAEKYYLLLEQGRDASDAELVAIKEKLDALTLPYHDNPAYIAYQNFLSQRRLVVLGERA